MGALKDVAISSLYMAVGPSLVLLNKHILSNVGFKYPMLLSSLGLIFSAVTAHLLAGAGVLTIGKRDAVTWGFWLRRVLPVGACHAATLAFGNAQYLHMGVALIQFLKAFTPIVVTAVSALLLGHTPSLGVVGSLVALCGGTAVTAAHDVSITPTGLFLAAGSATTEAVRLVLTQYVLQDCRFTLWESQFYLAPAAAFCLLCTGLWFEGGRLWASGDLALVGAAPLLFAGAASLGLGVQLLTAAVIQGPGAVTLKVLSQVRNAALVLAGVALFGEPVNAAQGAGYAVSLVAFGAYSWLNTKAPNATPKPKLKVSPRADKGSEDRAESGGMSGFDNGHRRN